MSAKSTEIANVFFEALKQTAEAHALHCEFFDLKTVESSWARKVVISEGPPKGDEIRWLLYFLVSVGQGFWGPNVKTVTTLESIRTQRGRPWGMALIEPGRGLYLDAKYVREHREAWSRSRDGHYKVKVDHLPNSALLLFRWDRLGCEELFRMAGFIQQQPRSAGVRPAEVT